MNADFRFKLINCAKSVDRRGFGCALFVGLLLALPVATAAKTPKPDLSQADWSVHAPHNLVDNPPSKDAVRTFIGHLPGSFADLGGKLCDFRFVDLRHSGTLSLVVSDDAGGTSDCSETDIFDKGAAGIEHYYRGGYLTGVEDIHGDGRFEIIVDVPDGDEYREASHGSGIDDCDACRACSETWPRIYAWTGSGYTEVSSQYPRYYERELKSLKKRTASIDASEAAPQLAASAASNGAQSAPRAVETEAYQSLTSEGLRIHQVQQSPETEPSAAAPLAAQAETQYPGSLDCLKAKAAKIERLLRISNDAGMDDAIRWANNTNPAKREFATVILSEIGTAEALKYEQTLANDSEHDVADSAKAGVKNWGWRKREKPSAFERSP